MRQHQRYLEQKISYNFKDAKLLTQAITHRSYSNKNNERFEFLGDAILSAIIGSELYTKFPKATEGELSRLRASLVNGETLSSIAADMQINKYILLGDGELKSGGLQRQSILADCVEAILAAIYLDSNFDVCKKAVLLWYKDKLNVTDNKIFDKDSKTVLQEWLQAKQYGLPEYAIISQTGTDHEQTFTVRCFIKELDIITQGVAKARRKAEQLAAQKALDLIDFNKTNKK